MKLKPAMNHQLIAPCGMNCGICMAYLREKKRCPGCRGPDTDKSAFCVRCRIRNCEMQKGFCFQCDRYPCRALMHLDNRYKTRYDMSMTENLDNINKLGIRKFVINEKARWACPDCGGIICVHRMKCAGCGHAMKH